MSHKREMKIAKALEARQLALKYKVFDPSSTRLHLPLSLILWVAHTHARSPQPCARPEAG